MQDFEHIHKEIENIAIWENYNIRYMYKVSGIQFALNQIEFIPFGVLVFFSLSICCCCGCSPFTLHE